ncbi:MAG TPA: hypothetical protein VH589_26980 [Trebonia sp.]|jgi:hypothetical protein
MKFRDHGIRDGAPRTLRLGGRGLSGGGIAIAVVSAGVAIGLAGCGPISSTGATGQASGGASSGMQTNSASASASATQKASTPATAAAAYSFRTLDNPGDLTFNQLLGFNNGGVIAGYFGSGAAGHPNKGYVLVRTQAGFKIVPENFPGSTQTQVTGLNDRGVTVGFWSPTNTGNGDANFGFYWLNGRFHTVNFPTRNNATPPVNQLLGVNNHDVAVGFYTDAKGNSHGYTFSIFGHRFHSVTVRGATSVTATAINNRNDVAGFFTNAAGTTESFLRTGLGRTYTLAVKGASMTQALGVNDFHAVVGVYTVGTGDAAVTHGFIWTPLKGFRTVDDPQGIGTTTINGVNDQGDIVGFYADAAGNTHGFAAVQQGHTPLPGLITMATPPPTMSTSPAPSTTPPSSMMPTTPPASPTTPTAPPTTPSAGSSGGHL